MKIANRYLVQHTDNNHVRFMCLTKNSAIQLRSDVDAETMWATQKQIADIFGIKIPTISKHIKNILRESKLYQRPKYLTLCAFHEEFEVIQ